MLARWRSLKISSRNMKRFIALLKVSADEFGSVSFDNS